ncbi:hypothetical protein [Mycoplasma anserisalpingitidis]|uniref:Uncharacterized protein n=1 Tax=Mycoplasma anserisalpingitidis TaxID=519450 RepID=A0A5B8JB75_9MOLU|nr:hypothetical protein [Mycoplasma anserisalpingitidis]QDY88516.1 hypothetical protein FOY43_02545 [Mycoplasma anserisalpingitidis]
MNDKTFNNFLNTSSILLDDKDYIKFLKYFASTLKNIEVPRFQNNYLVLKEKQHLLKNEGFVYEKVEFKINKEIDDLIEMFDNILLEMNFNSTIPKDLHKKYQINIIYKYKDTILKKVYLTIDNLKEKSHNNFLNFANYRNEDYSTIYTTKRKWYLYSEPYIKSSKFVINRSNKPHIDFYDIIEKLYSWFIELVEEKIIEFNPETFIKDFNDFKSRNSRLKYSSDLWDEYSPNTKKKDEIYNELVHYGLWNSFLNFINAILTNDRNKIFFNYNELIVKNYFIKNNNISLKRDVSITDNDIVDIHWNNFIEFCEEKSDFRIPDFAIGSFDDDEDDSLIKYLLLQYNLLIRYRILNNEYLNDKTTLIDTLTILNKIYDSGNLDIFINKIEEIKLELIKIISNSILINKGEDNNMNKYIISRIIDKIEISSVYITDIIQLIINNNIDKNYINSIEKHRNNEIFNFLFNSYKPKKSDSLNKNISYSKIIRDIHNKIKKIN